MLRFVLFTTASFDIALLIPLDGLPLINRTCFLQGAGIGFGLLSTAAIMTFSKNSITSASKNVFRTVALNTIPFLGAVGAVYGITDVLAEEVRGKKDWVTGFTSAGVAGAFAMGVLFKSANSMVGGAVVIGGLGAAGKFFSGMQASADEIQMTVYTEKQNPQSPINYVNTRSPELTNRLN